MSDQNTRSGSSPADAEGAGPRPGSRPRIRRPGTRRTRFMKLRNLDLSPDDLEEERKLLKVNDSRLNKLRVKALTSLLQGLREKLRARHPQARPRARLTCLEGRQTGQAFALDGVLVLGRDEKVDLEVQDPEVSRAHCRVETENGWDFRVIDLGSKNGTLLNGHKVDKAELHGGDVLTLGLSFFGFEHSEVQLAIELDDPALADAEQLRELVRFEALVSSAQERLAAVRHDLIQLDLARREHEESDAVQNTVQAFRQLAKRLLREARAKTQRAESVLARVLGEAAPAEAPPPDPASISELTRLEQELNKVVTKLKTLGSRPEGRTTLLRRKQDLEEKVEETRQMRAVGSKPAAPAAPAAQTEALLAAEARIVELEQELALRPSEIPDEMRLVAIALDHERGTEVTKLTDELAELQTALRSTETQLSEKIARFERDNLKLRTANLELKGRLREAVRELVLQAEGMHRSGQAGHASDLARRIVSIEPASDAARYLLARIEPGLTSGALRAQTAFADRNVPLSDSQLPPPPQNPAAPAQEGGA